MKTAIGNSPATCLHAIQQRSAGCKVIVMVLNWNGRTILPACLNAIMASTWPDFEIVVADNASTDDSAELVERSYPQVHLLRLATNLGVAGGRNASIEWARQQLPSDWYFLIDNDTLLAPEAVAELVAAGSEDVRIGIVTAKAFRSEGDELLLAAGGMGYNAYTGAAWDVAAGERDRGQHDRKRDVQACPGYAMFVRASMVEQLGGFDDGFNPYGWEDVDFSLRVRRHGFRIVYAPRAVVFHAGGRIGRGPVSAYEAHKARRLVRLVRRNSTWLQWTCFLVLFPLRGLWRVLRELLAGEPRLVGVWLKGLLGRYRAPGGHR